MYLLSIISPREADLVLGLLLLAELHHDPVRAGVSCRLHRRPGDRRGGGGGGGGGLTGPRHSVTFPVLLVSAADD